MLRFLSCKIRQKNNIIATMMGGVLICRSFYAASMPIIDPNRPVMGNAP